VEKRFQAQRHARKASSLYKAFSVLYQRLSTDEPLLLEFFVTRAELSPDKGTLEVFFAQHPISIPGKEKPSFEEALDILKLYKGSLRKGLGDHLRIRYLPKLQFTYDTKKEHELRVTDILTQISADLAHEDEVTEDDS
jgi:ribosome-binding factor A